MNPPTAGEGSGGKAEEEARSRRAGSREARTLAGTQAGRRGAGGRDKEPTAPHLPPGRDSGSSEPRPARICRRIRPRRRERPGAMWQVSALCLCRASPRAWQRRLPRPGPAWSPGPAAARGLSSMAPSIRLSPAARSLFDEPLAIAVRGLGPRQRVTLRTSLRDETGELFQASARYQAGEDGQLDLARCPALPGGSFSGLEPMGPLWALQPQRPFWRLVKRDVQSPFLLQLEVLEGHGERPGRLLAQAQHERAFLRDGVRRVPVREGRIRATLFLPPGEYRPCRAPSPTALALIWTPHSQARLRLLWSPVQAEDKEDLASSRHWTVLKEWPDQPNQL